jgi:uncharacterized iron-regulated protein
MYNACMTNAYLKPNPGRSGAAHQLMLRGSLLTLILLLLLPAPAGAQERPRPYRFFTAKGQAARFRQVLKRARQADVVFFGEEHNNPMAHWLQLRLLKALDHKGSQVKLGMEMLERDQQPLVAALNAGRLGLDAFADSTELWPNFSTDYRPLVAYAQQQGLPVVATNVPRSYARLVYHGGLSKLAGLPDSARAQMAPLPLEINYKLKSYQQMMKMAGHHGSSSQPQQPASAEQAEAAGDAEASKHKPHGHGGHGGLSPKTFVQAQAIKDATMAHFIAETAESGPNSTFLHINGAFHTAWHEGIVYYLRQYAPELDVLTITTRSQPSLKRLQPDHRKRADFILLTPTDMIKTYRAGPMR